MRLRDWLDQGEAQLAAGPHAERARRDAETLLQHHIGKNRAWLLAHAGDEYAGCSAIGYAAMLKRRAAGEPIQYITGVCEFYGLPFHVTPAVLIPRPETEHLVEAILKLTQGNEAARFVDVGTGSGAIAIAVAHATGSKRITAIDISEDALAVARQNAERNNVQVTFLQGDLLTPLEGEPFDLIASNPPYVAETDKPSLSAEVRDYEPSAALYAGADGLDIYRRLIPQAFRGLLAGGHIALEVGFGQAKAVAAILEQRGFFDLQYIADLQGIPRVLVAMRGKD